MKNLSVFILFIVAFQPSLSYGYDPKGWDVLKQTIQNTLFSDVSKLLNRTFDLEIEGATKDYIFTVQPESVFKVERLDLNKFRVTITDTEALVKKGLIVEYYPIGWSLSKLEPMKPNIIGKGNCLYNVTFSQLGVGELDLSKFDDDYEITHQLSNPESVSSITRAGKGYDIVRSSGSSSESKIRLRIKKKNGDYDLLTDWITIPLCKSDGDPSPSPVTKKPTTDIREELDLKINGISYCQEATGEYCTTFNVTATNLSTSRIKCNKVWFYLRKGDKIIAQEWVWIDVGAGQTHNFQVILKTPYRLDEWNYIIEKTGCHYK